LVRFERASIVATAGGVSPYGVPVIASLDTVAPPRRRLISDASRPSNNTCTAPPSPPSLDVDAPDDDFDDRLELIPRVVVVPDRFRFPPFVVGAFSSRPASSRVSIVFPSSPIAFAVFALRRALARFPRSPPIVTSHPDVPVVALRVAVVDRVARPPSRIALASSRIAPPARARRVIPPIAPRASADASPPSSARGRVARASSRASSCADNVD
jgi:hypothetical protein